MTHYEGARAPWSPWRYRRGLGEVARVVGLMLLYYVTRGWAVGREDAALDHARAIIALEQRLGIYREPGFNAWVTLHPLARDALNLGYTSLHLPVLAAFGFWLYWRRPGEYPAIRNTVFISAAAALLVYTLFPVAPPRLLPDQDFTDTLAAYSHVSYEMHSIQGFYNPYAALPSLHVGWCLLVGVCLCWLGRGPLLRLLGVALPTLMAVAVIGTANHFFLDALAGALVLGGSALLGYWPPLAARWRAGQVAPAGIRREWG